jgi:hypothetical protein
MFPPPVCAPLFFLPFMGKVCDAMRSCEGCVYTSANGLAVQVTGKAGAAVYTAKDNC